MPGLRIDLSKALCWTTHRQHAHLWDAELDGGTKNAKGETPESRRDRHALARLICSSCSQLTVCRAIAEADRSVIRREGMYGGVLI